MTMKRKEMPGHRRNPLKDVAMGVAGVIAVIYLLNPDAGLIELIPDNIPVIGNLDEFGAAVLLFRVWRHFRKSRWPRKDRTQPVTPDKK